MMPMPDGTVTLLLLSQDADELEACLEYLFTIEIGKELYLAQMPNNRYGWKPFAGAKRTGAKCERCTEPVYQWAGKLQQRLSCACTISILPLHGQTAIGLDKIDTEGWAYVVAMARKGITEWLKRN